MARRTQRVRLLTSAAGEVNGAEGDEVDLDEATAEVWIVAGMAEPVREPGPAPRGGERAVKAPKGEQR